ncbi:hypothetical protein [Paracoccus albus]|uniref:hypothetical protein n=1 Tax=Paracoccus albus TaxID=3017784 RepID=UPI0022F13042|nr:hypothetical protein [Paracoccus albus]WBU60580.1 hypothetical protein PAF20_01245 [Paracoccus albus]
MLEDHYVDEDGFTMLHVPSTCDRRPARMSKGHFTGQMMVGPWPGRVLHIESLLERKWACCLDAHETTEELREQVAFEWRGPDGRLKTHYFDLCVDQTDGARVAYTVKPEARLTEKFLAEISEIARQAKAAGFVDDVRLLTDADIDRVELTNAQLIRAMRKPDAEADAAAAAVLQKMAGLTTLGELRDRIDMGARGYRALIRCLADRQLSMTRHEPITHDTEVFKAGVYK